VATGPTFSPAVTGPRTYYVQALPTGAFACPSSYRPVMVTMRDVTRPTVTIPAMVVLGNTLDFNFAGQPAYYTYTWSWGDGTSSTGTAPSHLYQEVGTYTIRLTIKDERQSTATDDYQPPACTDVVEYTVVVADKMCEVLLPAGDLSQLVVQRSNRNGTYSFSNTAACGNANLVFDCLTGPAQSQEVVAASAISFTEGPAAPDPTYALSTADILANPFLAGAGRPHPEATYAYSTPVIDTYSLSTERGRFVMMPFNWQIGAQHRVPAWQRAGLATRFAPDGQAVEEQDILGIPSTVKLGYAGQGYAGGVLPYLTAKNAAFGDVLFESCETLLANTPLVGEDNLLIRASRVSNCLPGAPA
jgi:PKD domain